MEVTQVPICILYIKTVFDWSSCHAIETKEEQTINSSRKSRGGEAKHCVESISWTQLNEHLGLGSAGWEGNGRGGVLKILSGSFTIIFWACPDLSQIFKTK